MDLLSACRRAMYFASLILAGGLLFISSSAEAAPRFKHIFVVVLENTDYDKAMKQDYLQELAQQGALFTNYHAEVHPSQPNYISMIAGESFAIESGGDPDGKFTLDGRHLGDLLEEKGLTWHVYAEDYRGHPDKCDLSSKDGHYVRKHVPFLSFANIQSSLERCAHITGTTDFKANARVGNLANYTLYVPDMNNDGHDTKVKFASRWLKDKFEPLLANDKFMADTLFVVTFDEGSGSGAHERSHIATIFVGPSIVPGAVSDADLNHFSLLKLIEENFELGNLGKSDVSATAIEGIWK